MMYGFHIENTDLPYRSGDVGKTARVLKVWSDGSAEWYYRLYKIQKGWFNSTKWVEKYSTHLSFKAEDWAEHYGVEIELWANRHKKRL